MIKLFKILLIAFIMLFLSINVDAQVSEWINKQTDRVKNTATYKEVQYRVEQANPAEFIKDELNSRYNLDQEYDEIMCKANSLGAALENNTSMLNSNIIDTALLFNKINEYPKELLQLDSIGQYKNYKYLIRYKDEEYRIFKGNMGYYAVSKNNMPIDQNLENIILIVTWSQYMENINAEFFENIATLSKITYGFYQGFIKFYDIALRFIDAYSKINFAGMSAADLVGSYATDLGFNFNPDDIREGINLSREAMIMIQNESKEIITSTQQIVQIKNEILTTKKASYEDVVEAMNDFDLLASKLTDIKTKIEETRKQMDDYNNSFSKMTDFYGISMVERIGDVFSYLDRQYVEYENFCDEKAGILLDFNTNIKNTSNNYYQISSSKYKAKTKEIINNDFSGISNIKTLYSLIKKDPFLSEERGGFVSYLNRVNRDYLKLNKYKTKDFKKFIEIKDKLDLTYNKFPKRAAIRYYQNRLVSLDDKQILGGAYQETYLDDYKRILNRVDRNPRALRNLIPKTRQFVDYYKDVESSNTTFWVMLTILVLSVIGFLIFKFK